MRLSITGWILAAMSAATIALLAPQWAELVGELSSDSFPHAAVAAASLSALAVASWSLVITSAIAVGCSTRLVTAIAPAAFRRALLVGATGAAGAVSVLTVAPAHAEQQLAPDTSQHSVAGLALPDRPDATDARAARPALPTSPEADAAGQVRVIDQVLVRPGDTLWAIARRHLPAGATNAQIATATVAWHRANREVIGDDPDLVVPAQLLTPPPAKDLP